MSREALLAEARTWLGTPFHHEQSAKGLGCDCIGFVGGSTARAGIDASWVNGTAAKYRGYGRQPNPDLLLEACDRFMDRIAVNVATVADVLVFRFRKQPQHFALISRIDPIYILHSWEGAGGVVENRLDHVWASRILRAYRIRGL